mmetsp:Transcript_9852/g.12214  ORF Transcript_9852/g.12214 Transcript_9852/m.12214 type:complete len:301 (-) Transcript_9852:248-1150(-)|eukprot:CAMPEP_0170455254 /NCGR_PEP_ID=MMETSP0123-20130129/3275_1 /TAXON_ID=182087 /ORGANISM="Favella ehrenbergii, Strain Fehren 1" /LENGTH=300 /DNA_ID=CAMNT_0010718321 /DNA_START=1032 /DNA_END=1934 /DNA_ORIENTATION=-
MAFLKSKFTIGKGGDSAFKVLADGSYLNAYATIADTFRNIEESITVSGANEQRPGTVGGNSTGRVGTAISGNSKKSVATKQRTAIAAEQQTASLDPSLESLRGPHVNVFSIGINCDGESVFNKDPKDPNKYEVEGQKAQSSTQQLVDYYVKMCQEHPLLSYLEDPFAERDMEGYRKLREALLEAGLTHVKIGMRAIFKSSLHRVREVTSVRPLTAEEQDVERAAKEAEAQAANEPAPTKGGKKQAAADKAQVDSSMSYRSPNCDKFVPHCVSIRTSPLDTMSDLIDFFRYSNSMGDENRF